MKISSSDQGGEGTHHIDQLDESQSKGYLDLLGHVLDGSDQLVVAPEQVSHQPLLVPRAHPCNRKSSVCVKTQNFRSSLPMCLASLLQGDMEGVHSETESTDDGIGFATVALRSPASPNGARHQVEFHGRRQL